MNRIKKFNFSSKCQNYGKEDECVFIECTFSSRQMKWDNRSSVLCILMSKYKI